MGLRRLKVGDLVKLDPTRMTHKGYFPPNWDMNAVLVVLWVPEPDSPSQVVSVLMKGGSGSFQRMSDSSHSTVTDFARFLGLSTLHPRFSAILYERS